MPKSIGLAVSVLVLLSLLAACGAPAATPAPVEVTRIVVETQIVQGAPVEVTRVVKEQVQVTNASLDCARPEDGPLPLRPTRSAGLRLALTADRGRGAACRTGDGEHCQARCHEAAMRSALQAVARPPG